VNEPARAFVFAYVDVAKSASSAASGAVEWRWRSIRRGREYGLSGIFCLQLRVTSLVNISAGKIWAAWSPVRDVRVPALLAAMYATAFSR
jgi:hypothetical protein